MDNLTPAALQIFAHTPTPEALDRGEAPLERTGYRFTLSDGSVREWLSPLLLSQTVLTTPDRLHIRVRAFADSGYREVFRVLVEERDPSHFGEFEDPTACVGMYTVQFRREWGTEVWAAPSVTWSRLPSHQVDALYRDDLWMADGSPSLSRIMRALLDSPFA